jgi:hypothetical protein
MGKDPVAMQGAPESHRYAVVAYLAEPQALVGPYKQVPGPGIIKQQHLAYVIGMSYL